MKRYSGGGSWMAYSPRLTFGQGWAEEPNLVIDAQGNPVIAWVQASSIDPVHIEVARLDSAGWSFIGNGFYRRAGAQPRSPVVALDRIGQPWVVWIEDQEFVVARSNAGAWELVGSTALDTRVTAAFPPVLRFDTEGRAVVACRWNGSDWVPIDGIGESSPRLPGSTIVSVGLALHARNVPVLAVGEWLPGGPAAPRSWVDVRRLNAP